MCFQDVSRVPPMHACMLASFSGTWQWEFLALSPAPSLELVRGSNRCGRRRRHPPRPHWVVHVQSRATQHLTQRARVARRSSGSHGRAAHRGGAHRSTTHGRAPHAAPTDQARVGRTVHHLTTASASATHGGPAHTHAHAHAARSCARNAVRGSGVVGGRSGGGGRGGIGSWGAGDGGARGRGAGRFGIGGGRGRAGSSSGGGGSFGDGGGRSGGGSVRFGWGG